jgi:hypothetical protein
MVFVLASAVVAFRGWPSVGNSSGPSSIVFGNLAARHTAPSGVDRQLLVAAAATPGSAGAAGSGATRARTHGSSHQTVAPASQVVAGTRPVGTGAQQTSTVAPPPQHGSPAGGCGSSCGGSSPPTTTNPVTTVIQTATGALGKTVSSATQSLGSTVSGVAKVIATKLGLGQAGAAAGSVVNGAGTLVTNTGNAVGGLLGGH